MTRMIVYVSERGARLADVLKRELDGESTLHAVVPGQTQVGELAGLAFGQGRALVFIGALGICVRAIAPHLSSKKSDPAVVCVDELGRNCVSVVSGHLGGANALCLSVARACGARPILSTASDLQELWPLDLLPAQNGWILETHGSLTQIQALWAARRPTALLLECADERSRELEREKPSFVDVYHDYGDIPEGRHECLLQVGYRVHAYRLPTLVYRVPCLSLGVGCTQGASPAALVEALLEGLTTAGLSVASLAVLSSSRLKAEEPALHSLGEHLGLQPQFHDDEALRNAQTTEPSATVQRLVGLPGVSEPSALLASKNGGLLLPKQKRPLGSGGHATFAVALLGTHHRRGRVAFVGAGPGDPKLMTLRARELLCEADLVLYAGSLVPEALTRCAKPGATVRSSAGLALREQVEFMLSFVRRGELVVRLHTGDPSLYGAIQEQIEELEAEQVDYFVVPGVSAFQAAAARLRRELTAPDLVQSIILTRGAGQTPVPERESLRELARHQASLCIYLSAGLVDTVQAELLVHYPPETPVAVLYRVSWPDERVFTGTLAGLAALLRDNALSRTTLIIVSPALAARGRRSHLYDPAKPHGYRPATTP